MKKVFLLILSVFCMEVFSRESLTYSEVVKVDSVLNSNDLYARVKSWFAESYRNAQNVIQMDDAANAKIIGKGNFRYSSTVFSGGEKANGWIRYTITIEAKDGRYRYAITDFIHESKTKNYSFNLITDDTDCPYKVGGSGVTQGWRNKVWKDMNNTINKNAEAILKSLKGAMDKPVNSMDTDW